MQTHYLAKQDITRGLVGVIVSTLLFSTFLFSTFLFSTLVTGAEKTSPPALSTPTSAQLDLSLPAIYTTPPPAGTQNDLRISQNIHSGSLQDLKTVKAYPFGYQQLKVDNSMRIRGWQVRDKFYIGQARVGEDWGLGMMLLRGNFAYGLNDDGVGMTYKGENSIYRINMEEISFEIDF